LETNSSRICLRKPSAPLSSMASNVTPSIPGAPSLFLAIRYASHRVSILQTWMYSPQKRQDGSAFALTYRLLLRSCKLMGAFIILPLPPFLLEPSQTAGPLRSADVTPLPRYYRPSRIPLAVHRLPGVAGYTISLLRRFRDGARRVSPVARHDRVTVLSLPTPPKCFAVSVPCGTPCCLRPKSEGSAFGDQDSRGHTGSLALRPGNSLATLMRWLCQ
jgi:hypothetical protein